MSDFWDREVIEQQHVNWMGIPAVRVYLNDRVGGEQSLWPIDWFELWLNGRKFDRALSIGCGSGVLERQLVQRGLCRSFDAFDGSVVSLREARRQADAEGVGDRIRYYAADFNEPFLPRARYDIVMFHQSAHHVGKLEKLYRAIHMAMKPDALLYMDEYVGPSRYDWMTDPRLMDVHHRAYESVAAELRTVERLNPPIQADDPSEAIRSSEIEPQLAIGFDTIARRPYGGGVLSVVLPSLRVQSLDAATVDRLIAEDRNAPAYYTLIVARPKQGLRGTIARVRYAFEPKIKKPVWWWRAFRLSRWGTALASRFKRR